MSAGDDKMKERLLLIGVVGSGLLALALLVGSSPDSRATTLTPLSPGVVINEVAWGGTAASSADEWIELYNPTGNPVDLSDWTLRALDGQPTILLEGSVGARSYFLLERSDDCTVRDIAADLTYAGGLSNEGEYLQLLAPGDIPVDSVDGRGGWPAGSGSPGYYSLERIDPAAAGDATNWTANNGWVANGLDCNGLPLNGTPRARNSASYGDLSVAKLGPATAAPGERITYTLVVSNIGQLPAYGTRLTDVLPVQVRFEAQDSAFSFSQPDPGSLLWTLGTVPTTTAAAPLRITVTARLSDVALGELTNLVTVTAATTESRLIESLYARTYGGIDDEAFRLMNVSSQPAPIGGWTLRDGEGTITFTAATSLAPGQRIWCSRKADAFYTSFGFWPDYEWAGANPAVPDLAYSGSLRFNDDGDEVILRHAGGDLVDELVYGSALATGGGWNGPALTAYHPSSAFPAKGQILYRQRDEGTGWPLGDTDTAADWAQDREDALHGRRVQYPGWDGDDFFWTARVTETAVLTVAVGPDHLLEALVAQIERAQQSIWIEGYTFESEALAQALLRRLEANVSVKVLFEAGPSGGIAEAQRWICGQIQAAGGEVYFLSGVQAPTRYRTQHAKVLLIDDRWAVISSENLNPTGMPSDTKGDGTAGRRGVALMTDAPGVVDRVRAIMIADMDPVHHGDVVTCAQAPDLCAGSPPLAEPKWTSYTVVFSQPLTLQGQFAFEVVQSPDNSLREGDALLGLVARAGRGDTVLVEQFHEPAHWGPATATPASDPNLRLEAYVAAARRGARVRVLLDSYFNQADNAATAVYLEDVARREGLSLRVRLANPTCLGLHTKMVLARIDGRGYVHVGSINGSEASSKINRELALQVQSDEAYAYLLAVFKHDWGPEYAFLPLVPFGYQPPLPADHLLIGEVYAPSSPERQWVKIYNPTDGAIDLSSFKMGDAANLGDYEGMVRFPAGTLLGSQQALLIAVSAAALSGEFPGCLPDVEITDSDPAVPNMVDYAAWGEGQWWLRQDGDEVLLLGAGDAPVDALAYGDSVYPLVVPHPGLRRGHSLERWPIWLDTDDCRSDFRDQPQPNPCGLP